jgi:hypothetical protein
VHRAGHPAEAFAAIWISLGNYHLRAEARTGEPVGIAVTGIRILKVRPLKPKDPTARPGPAQPGRLEG